VIFLVSVSRKNTTALTSWSLRTSLEQLTHGFIFFTCKEHSHKRFHFTAHIILYHQLQKQGMIQQSSLLLWYCGTRIFASHQGREIFVSGSSASSVLDSASVSYSSCKHVSIPYSNRSTLVGFELTEVNNNVWHYLIQCRPFIFRTITGLNICLNDVRQCALKVRKTLVGCSESIVFYETLIY